MAFDVCNGIQDNSDPRIDEDTWAVSGPVITLSTDSPTDSRVAVAASQGGFFVAFSAYCTMDDMVVNHVASDGTLAQASGACASARGIRVLDSSTRRSRHAALAAQGNNAAVVWTEGTAASGQLLLGRLTLTPGATPALVVNETLPVLDTYGTVFDPFDVMGGVAVTSTGYLTVSTQDVTGEMATARGVTRAGGLALAGESDLGRSTDAEVALTALASGGYVAAWQDLNNAMVRFLDANAQPVGAPLALDNSPRVPYELVLSTMDFSHALLAFHEEEANNTVPHISLAVATQSPPSLQKLAHPINTPAARWNFGAAYTRDREAVVVTSDELTGALVLHVVNTNNGVHCGPAVAVNPTTQMTKVAVAALQDKLLVVWAEDTGSGKILAVLMNRVHG